MVHQKEEDFSSSCNMKKTSYEIELVLINANISSMQSDIKEIKDSLNTKYSTKGENDILKERIDMVSRIVYGAVGLIGLAVLGALVNGVLK